MTLPIGTKVEYRGVPGVVRGYWGSNALTVEFSAPLGTLNLHDCHGAVPSGMGRWMGREQLKVINDDTPLQASVKSYITKELGNDN